MKVKTSSDGLPEELLNSLAITCWAGSNSDNRPRYTSMAEATFRIASAARSHVICFAFLLLTSGAAIGQEVRSVTGDSRVDGLLGRMTLAEKLSLIHDAREDPRDYQGQAGFIGGVARLGIRGLRLADGPPGVLTRVPAQAETATMGVAATFDVGIARLNGVVIGREARVLGIDVSLQPFINIDRDLAMRRLYNTFGEDPLLTGAMGAATIRGIQSQGVMAMAKHFIGFDTAGTDVWVDQQTLHEVYAAPFEAAIQAGVASVMCSYNHVNGPYACGNSDTLDKMLRTELGFRGFVTSDWGATHSALFMNSGLDVEMIDGPDSTGFQEPAFLGAVAAALPPPATTEPEALGDIYGGSIPEEFAAANPDETDYGEKVPALTLEDALAGGKVTEATVTRSAGRVLLQMQRFGMLDSRASHQSAPQEIAADARIIEQTAEEAAVLLKNGDGALPLQNDRLDSVVLIGPTAGQVDAIGIAGERSLGMPQRQVSPLTALRRLSGNPNIRYAVDDDMTGSPIPAANFSHDGKLGLERRGSGGLRSDPSVDFTTKAGTALPPDSTATWNGSLAVERAGLYWLYLQALGTNARLYVDGKRIAVTGVFQGDVHGDILQANQDNVVPTTDGLDNVRQEVRMAAGAHPIRIEISPDTSHSPVQLRLNWYPPEQRRADHDAAIEAAKQARTAVVFAWARRSPTFALPGEQDRLIEEVAAVNPRTIVVLNTSQPVALPWAGSVRAILEMWWPGDEGGWATGKLLLGKVSPAGRLPVTWARRLQDYPATDPRFPERSAEGIDHKTTYSEGVNVGYRWFDHEGIEPLFPFGFGLSYTRFEYSALRVARTLKGGLRLTCTIRNAGDRAGDEVPQAYLGAPEQAPPGAAFSNRKLVAFDRIHLAAGQSTTLHLNVPLRQLQYWSSTEDKWKTAKGDRTVSVGSSSRTLPLERTVRIAN
jgi:beta-glucosidase